MPIEPITFTMFNGTTARGFANSGPELEYVTIEHETPHGVFREVVLRAVAPPPPVEEPPQQQQQQQQEEARADDAAG